MIEAKLEAQALRSPVAPSAELAFGRLVSEAAVRVRLRHTEPHGNPQRNAAFLANRVSVAW